MDKKSRERAGEGRKKIKKDWEGGRKRWEIRIGSQEAALVTAGLFILDSCSDEDWPQAEEKK